MRFDSYHPFINLIYFVAVIAFSISFNHPVFVLIAYLSMFLYSIKLGGVRQLIFNLVLIVPMVAYTLWYSYYNHFGVTVLTSNFIDNKITLEALLYGLQVSVTAVTIVMIMSCVFIIFSTDKIVYLFGRVSPKLSLFISILLRTVPRVKKEYKKITLAQKGIGRCPGQRGLIFSVFDYIRAISITITWTLENFVESAASMKSRGYSLKGRTAYSIYRFDDRDRSFVIVLFFCLYFTGCGWLLNQTNIHYNPEIVINQITPLSFVFYFIYALFFLLPMILQIVGEYRFNKLRNKLTDS